MTIPVVLRELLACPRCHGPLVDAVQGTALDCVACELRYPVRDGIPVLLKDQAQSRSRGVS